MKFSLAAIAALLSTAAFAAPLDFEIEERDDAAAVSMMAAAPQWTIVNMKRVCNAADTSCAWSYAINQNNGTPATACKYTVKGAKASEKSTSNIKCGGYTVSSGWSGQFGPNNGFTTLAVVNNAKKLIIYPAYTDKQLDTNKVVSPNQSYTPQNLP